MPGVTISTPTTITGGLQVTGTCTIAGAHTGHVLVLKILDNLGQDKTSNYTITGPTLNTTTGAWTATVKPAPPTNYTIEVICQHGNQPYPTASIAANPSGA
jgi:hypothetical protein